MERAGYANNAEFGSTSFVSLEEQFGFPTFVVHRGDLHRALLDRAVELGVSLKVEVRALAPPATLTLILLLQSFIEDVDFEKTSLLIKESWRKHDVILGADGIKSEIRKKMTARRGEVDETIDTGEAAYRARSCRFFLRYGANLPSLQL